MCLQPSISWHPRVLYADIERKLQYTIYRDRTEHDRYFACRYCTHWRSIIARSTLVIIPRGKRTLTRRRCVLFVLLKYWLRLIARSSRTPGIYIYCDVLFYLQANTGMVTYTSRTHQVSPMSTSRPRFFKAVTSLTLYDLQ